jgi:uncharacterized protein (TIGR00369 family)
MTFRAADPDFERRIRDSFNRQAVMHLIGAEMIRVEPGFVEIELPYREDLTQQHGFFHAGMTSTIADSAGGYAGYTLFPADSSVLTVEYKINLVAPADGEKIIATGQVKKSGKTLTICELEVLAVKNGMARSCAYGLQTLICLEGRADAPSAR